jgi:hypothetical protein
MTAFRILPDIDNLAQHQIDQSHLDTAITAIDTSQTKKTWGDNRGNCAA